MTTTGGWTSEWPTVPGDYWAYGYHSYMRSKPTLELAKVRLAGSEPNKFLMYSYRGGFLSEQEAKLLWLPAELPEVPAAEDLEAVPDPKEAR